MEKFFEIFCGKSKEIVNLRGQLLEETYDTFIKNYQACDVYQTETNQWRFENNDENKRSKVSLTLSLLYNCLNCDYQIIIYGENKSKDKQMFQEMKKDLIKRLQTLK
ncbi:MAG: hypothetical protein QW244_02620 [Candidatus Pacearchaeota archaeon]